MTDTGRFFGEVEKPIMESMLHVNIFKRLTIYDLQGLCKNVTEVKDPDDPNAGSGLMTVRHVFVLSKLKEEISYLYYLFILASRLFDCLICYVEILQPFKLFFIAFKWMLTEMIVELSRIKLWVVSSALPDSDYIDSPDYTEKQSETKHPVTIKKLKKGFSLEDEEWFLQEAQKKKQNETLYYACDKKSELYVLQQDFILHNRGYSLDVPTNDSR